MNEEEKKAINYLEKEYKKLEEEGNILFPLFKQQAKIVLNLIIKLQKENKTTTKLNANMSKRHLNDTFKIKKLQKENKEKDKQIDLMSDYIREDNNEEKYCIGRECNKEVNCKICIKEYFEKLAEQKE